MATKQCLALLIELDDVTPHEADLARGVIERAVLHLEAAEHLTASVVDIGAERFAQLGDELGGFA